MTRGDNAQLGIILAYAVKYGFEVLGAVVIKRDADVSTNAFKSGLGQCETPMEERG